MKASELRIGNYVYADDEINATTILGIYHDGRVSTSEYEGGDLVGFLDPVPLTEEWLLRLGFEFYEGEMIGTTSMNDNWTLGLFKINVWGNGWLFYWDDKFDNRLQYVHQLQNLYFALTGEELILKPA